MAIPEGHIANFDTLSRAWKAGDVCLLECIRKSDGEMVAMICTVEWDGEYYRVTPFAEMVNGDPFEDYLPPAGGKVKEDVRIRM